MKNCSKCNIEQSESNFSKDKKGKGGLCSQCKNCIKIYQQKNKENINKTRRVYSKNNRKHIKKVSTEYRKNNQESIKKQTKKYKKDNKAKLNEKSNIYWQNNKDKKRLKNKKYKIKNRSNRNEKEKLKRLTDSLYKLIGTVRSLVRQSIKKNGFKKNTKTAIILGCTFEDFKLHLESKFEYWMNWDNHGLYTGNYNETWQIDHIIPISSASTEEDIIKLNHYTNLQPLCSKKNQDKKAKLNYENLQVL